MAVNGVISYKGRYPFGITGIKVSYNVNGTISTGTIYQQTKSLTWSIIDETESLVKLKLNSKGIQSASIGSFTIDVHRDESPVGFVYSLEDQYVYWYEYNSYIPRKSKYTLYKYDDDSNPIINIK